ncbi:MAG: EAL domain-containing protein [Actinomycetota bacterium]|nr:EAL domain-containing protein [Actinomycetota bacterium]
MAADPFASRRVRWYAVVGLVSCAVYMALPRGSATQLLFVAIAVSVPVMGWYAVREQPATARTALTLITIGCAFAAIGEVAEYVLLTLSVAPGSGSLTDLVFLTAYVWQLCGLMSMFRSQTASRHQFGWFDAAAVGIMVLTVVWTTLYEAIFGDQTATFFDWLTRFGGAVLGVALVVMALRLVITDRWRNRSLVVLLGGLVLQLVTDSTAALWNSYEQGSRVDTLWFLSYVLIGIALLEIGHAAVERRAATRLADQEIKHTLVLQAVVTVLLAAMIVAEVAGVLPLASLVLWAVSWVAIIVITRVRVFALLRQVGEAAATENQRRLTAMVASSGDVIGLADPDGLIRYLTPSITRLTGTAVDSWIGQRFDAMLATHFDGLHDLAARCALLGPDESATWEATLARPTVDGSRTVRLTIANQVDEPEVSGWVITAQDVTDQARLTAELRHQSLHDDLTGLPNRGLLFDRIQHTLDRMSRVPGTSVAVVLVDIDDFKAVNDSLGHTTGDELLRAVAERLTRSVRNGDTVARLGGDEFAVLLEDTNETEAMLLAGRALESLALPVHIGTGDFAVRASAGVVCHRGGAEAVDLLRSADIAMYASKRDGKSKVTLFEEHMHDMARDHLELRMDLATALQQGQLALVYQPIVDTNSRRVSGVEALLRWHHPQRGMVSPAEFIPIAEQSGQITAIGEWVLRTACAEAASWPGEGLPYVSVNVAAPQLRSERFIDLVISTLATTRLAPARLLLEITESMLVDDSANARTTLARLRQLGVRIAIDDFGTGYSSLAYLRSLSVDVVKIDQSFIRDLGTNTDHQALTRTILALADGLDMTAIAEGVETDREFDELTRLGCLYAQGYLFSRPITPEHLRELLGATPTAACT